VLLDNVDDLLTVLLEFGLDGSLVLGECVAEFAVLGVLFNSGNGSACGAFAADEVLESDREEVALVG